MTSYILFDKDLSKTKVWRKRLGNHPITVVDSSVDKISADIFVSPANGYGQLDGGIDKVYRTMYPGIQDIVNDTLRQYRDKKPPLGVGSAILVQVLNRKVQLLLAPTMELPSKLKTPWNCFWAALAIFYLTKDLSGITVAIPGLGTGTGHIESDEMIDMVKLAWTVSQTQRLEDVYRDYRYDYVPGVKLVLIQSLHEQPIPQHIRLMIQQ